MDLDISVYNLQCDALLSVLQVDTLLQLIRERVLREPYLHLLLDLNQCNADEAVRRQRPYCYNFRRYAAGEPAREKPERKAHRATGQDKY